MRCTINDNVVIMRKNSVVTAHFATMPRTNIVSTYEQRQLVIFHNAKGKSYQEIAELLCMRKSTVGNIVRRFKNEDRIEDNARSGRPKKLTEHDERVIIRTIKRDPRISAPKLVSVVAESLAIDVSESTIRRVIYREGMHGRIARKKPFVSEVNRIRRISFAKDHLSHGIEFWKRVIFSDESKFNIFGSDGRVNVWRKPNTELQKEHLRATVKHGGGSVMVWGCFSADGPGKLVFVEGIMKKESYLKILQDNLKSSADMLGIGSNFMFYQDNDPKHTAHIVREWCLYNCPKVIKTAAQSPDLNPIENLWQILDLAIRKRNISSREHLKTALAEEWAKISVEVTSKLVNSMPKRLSEVISNKGYATKY